MSPVEVLRDLRSLASSPGRLLLTLLGIVIGAASIVVVMGLLEGGKRALIATNQGVTGSDLVVVSRKALPERQARHNRPELSRADGAAVSGTRLVSGAPVHADSGRDVRAFHRDRNKRVRIVSGNPSMLDLYRIRVERGRFLKPSDLEARRRVCVVGDEIYRDLLKNAPLDESLALSVDGARWQVVGVLEKKPMLGSTSGTRIWARKVIVPATSFDLQYAPDHGADRLVVRSFRGSVGALRSTLDALLGRRHAGAKNFELDDPSGREQEKLVLGVIELLLIGTGALALFVGGINVMNVMLVRVSERTREIGLRRALGATRRSVLALFLTESVVLSTAGGALGVALGVALVAAAALGLGQVFRGFPLVVPPVAPLLGVGLSLLTGVVFGVLPAWRASRLEPVAALREE
jgi:putative ABC transport system permease protein